MADDDEERPDLRDADDVPDPDERDAEDDMDDVERPTGAASGRIRSVRERLRDRRVRKGSRTLTRRSKVRQATKPARERIQAAGDEVEQASDEARLLASELGLTTGQASQLASRAVDGIQQAAAAGGDALTQLDTDGDGDTDILEAIEEQEIGATVDPGEPPVGEVEDDFDELELEGIEEDLGLDHPIEDDQRRGRF